MTRFKKLLLVFLAIIISLGLGLYFFSRPLLVKYLFYATAQEAQSMRPVARLVPDDVSPATMKAIDQVLNLGEVHDVLDKYKNMPEFAEQAKAVDEQLMNYRVLCVEAFLKAPGKRIDYIGQTHLRHEITDNSKLGSYVIRSQMLIDALLARFGNAEGLIGAEGETEETITLDTMIAQYAGNLKLSREEAIKDLLGNDEPLQHWRLLYFIRKAPVPVTGLEDNALFTMRNVMLHKIITEPQENRELFEDQKVLEDLATALGVAKMLTQMDKRGVKTGAVVMGGSHTLAFVSIGLTIGLHGDVYDATSH